MLLWRHNMMRVRDHWLTLEMWDDGEQVRGQEVVVL